MRVTVRFFTTLREITQKREEEVELPNGANIKELLTILSNKYGSQFTDYVYNEKGEARSHLQFLVNGRSATTLQGLETKLRTSDRVAIIPPVGGG